MKTILFFCFLAVFACNSKEKKDPLHEVPSGYLDFFIDLKLGREASFQDSTERKKARARIFIKYGMNPKRIEQVERYFKKNPLAWIQFNQAVQDSLKKLAIKK